MLSLEVFKKKLRNNRLEVQREEGYLKEEEFLFNPKAMKKELDKLPKETPADILAFLEQNNGASLFVDPEYGGGFQLFSTEEIIDYKQIWECPEKFVPIGAGPDGEWIICQILNDGTNRMLIGEFLSFEDEDGLKINTLPFDFVQWLDYLLVAQGAQYWDWFRGNPSKE